MSKTSSSSNQKIMVGYAVPDNGKTTTKTFRVLEGTTKTRYCGNCRTDVKAELTLGYKFQIEPAPRFLWQCKKCGINIRYAYLEMDVINNTLQDVLN